MREAHSDVQGEQSLLHPSPQGSSTCYRRKIKKDGPLASHSTETRKELPPPYVQVNPIFQDWESLAIGFG